MDLRRVKQVNYLENTVLLYRGTKEMYSQYGRGQQVSHGEDDSQLLWTDYKNFVSELEKDSSIIKNTKNRTEQWRFQNGLTDFFKFLQDELQLTRDSVEQEDVCNWAAKLLCLFDAVKSIENCSETFAIPYLFEHLCNGMRDIMGSDMCYLTYYSDGNFTPLATSSFKRDMLDYALGESDYIQLLRKWELEEKKTWTDKLIAGTVFRSGIWKKSVAEEICRHFHIIVLKLCLPNISKDQFYAVFQSDDTGSVTAPWEIQKDRSVGLTGMDLECARNILFLRTRLTVSIRNSFHVLITSQKTYQYVRPLPQKDRRDVLTILHLTDLHVKCKDRDKLKKFFENFPETTDKGDKIDLVVITGDIVQGQCTAGELEEHYLLADYLLRKLACRLWHYADPSYLRSDWRKRIVIIPGNHDYASMNELEVISQKGIRSTGIGRPAQKEGGPMVKFAYYIQFVHRLLGIDVGEQIRDWLNSIRYYEQMKLALLCLNTSAGSGPLRNNKVHIDLDFVKKVENSWLFKDLDTVCLAHHTFVYKADYAVDRYYTQKIEKKNPKDPIGEIQKYVDEFDNILKLPLNTEVDRTAVKGRIDQLYEQLLHIDMSPEEDVFMTDVSYYRSNFREADNERCESIRSAMRRDRNMQASDQVNQLSSFKSLVDTAKIKIILGGHIHATRLTPEYHCYEGPLFYSNGSEVSFGILEMDRSAGIHSNTHSWRFQAVTEEDVETPGLDAKMKPDPTQAQVSIPTTEIDLSTIM